MPEPQRNRHDFPLPPHPTEKPLQKELSTCIDALLHGLQETHTPKPPRAGVRVEVSTGRWTSVSVTDYKLQTCSRSHN